MMLLMFDVGYAMRYTGTQINHMQHTAVAHVAYD